MKQNYDYTRLNTLKNCGIDLVAYVVSKDFKNAMQYIEKDDLVGFGVFGLLRAAREYDPAKKVSFPTFACKKVRQAIVCFVRQKCQKRYKYLEELESWQAGKLVSLQADEYDWEDERAYVRRMVNKLPRRHKNFVTKYWLKETPYRKMPKKDFFRLRDESLALLRAKLVGANGRSPVQNVCSPVQGSET